MVLWMGIIAAALLTHTAQVKADDARGRDDVVRQPFFAADGPILRAFSLGHEIFVADVMWVRTVLMFADTLDVGGEERVEWLRGTLRAITDLDPSWRTVYFYGGGMMRIVGDIDGSDDLYKNGMEAHPDDPFFPFSIGMNAYIYRKDVQSAADFLKIAATKPKAPDWYKAAAVGVLGKKGR